MDESGNFLEDFLASLETVPNDMRRNFELMRELDRQSQELTQEVDILEKKYILKFKHQRLTYKDIENDMDVVQINQVRGKRT